MTLQWKCNEQHPGCEAQEWQPYKEMSEADARDFMQTKAQNSKNFIYRIKPERKDEGE